VGRLPVTTRHATVDDMAALLALVEECQCLGSRSERAVAPVASPMPPGELRQALARVLESTAEAVIVAVLDGGLVGMVVVCEMRPHPLAAEPVGQVSHMVVSSRYRRCGVGHALVAAAVAWADERGLEQLAVNVFPSLREAHRFYAQVGFAPLAMRRVAPVAVLRRRLSGAERRPLDVEVVRRRSLRRPPRLATLRRG
jgi:GNAT superfamily N-acetyltransferase